MDEGGLRQHRDWWDNIPPDQYEQACAAHKPLFEALDAVYFKYCQGSLLEVGCGTGRFLTRLVERGITGIGLDVSIRMLRGAAAKGHRMLVNAPGEALPFRDGSFDTVVATFGVFKYVDRARGHAEVLRVLRPNGHLVFDLINYWPGLIDHIWWYYARKGKLPTRRLLDDYYLRLTAVQVSRDPVRGSGDFLGYWTRSGRGRGQGARFCCPD